MQNGPPSINKSTPLKAFPGFYLKTALSLQRGCKSHSLKKQEIEPRRSKSALVFAFSNFRPFKNQEVSFLPKLCFLTSKMIPKWSRGGPSSNLNAKKLKMLTLLAASGAPGAPRDAPRQAKTAQEVPQDHFGAPNRCFNNMKTMFFIKNIVFML